MRRLRLAASLYHERRIKLRIGHRHRDQHRADTVGVGKSPASEAISANTPNGRRLYAVNSQSNSVSVTDTSTNNVVATVAVGVVPGQVVVAPNGKKAYVANALSSAAQPIATAASRSELSSAEELHPHALPEPYVSLSTHTAPINQPMASPPGAASVRTMSVDVVRSPPANVPPAGDAPGTACISALPTNSG